MFANNNYAKVWKIFPKEKKEQKYTVVQLSTSRKDKKTNSYSTDFSGYVRLVGTAEEKAKELEAQDKIKLLTVGVTNSYDKASKKTFTQYVCFDFEFDNSQKQAETNGSGDEWAEMDENAKLPFED